ncbi:hypothetical protein NSA23_14365 [Anaerosalibacter massiliensis]|uniref:Flavoprotein domain-containing protein n=1 Tax=Anaerosalibacter massiliensis TaxID=1347392 RepID=A0A9X2S652_9FIRM|nr:flavoprotein [Anaerosalibacter massiliensis]MCR2045285.1 hypothetical protein [Anaerosalibacter massiliensis]
MAKNKITLNVLADITKRINGGNFSNSKEKALIVFTGSNIEINKKVQELKRLKKNNIQVSLAFSFMAKRILDTYSFIDAFEPYKVYGEEDIFDLENILKNYCYVIGPNITINTLSKVSLGMIDSFVPNIIWTYLYMGKKVYLDFTSVKNYFGEPPKNGEIRDIIENHINALKKMGVIEIEEGNYIEKIVNKSKSPIFNKDASESTIFNKVITERDVMNYSSNSKSIVLPKGTIITPLAKERIKELGIKIELERSGGR